MTVERTTILLIEDNPGDVRLIREMLAGASVGRGGRLDLEVADRLWPGLERIDLGGIDVVLLDLSLPDSQGLDTLEMALAQASGAPIIVLTGLDDEELGVQAVQAGAQDYLIKGQVDVNLLVRAMRYAIERKRAEKEREALIEELDAFAHTVAHDLKYPIQLIVGHSAMLEEVCTTIPGEELQEELRTITQQGLKMSNITDELLLLAGIRNLDVLPIEPLDMASIVAEAQQRLAYEIEERGAEIVLPAEWPVAMGYGPWIEEIWANYLSNALKYGGQPPYLELGATEQPNGMLCFWVADNGPGISPDKQAQLFAPFTRLDRIRATGHGLGLSIVRRIVNKLGGQVGVESNGTPGRGSTFSFTLRGFAGEPPPETADLEGTHQSKEGEDST